MNFTTKSVMKKFDELVAMLKPRCKYCFDLDEMEKEYPDEPHHGATLFCGECQAEYYEEWGGKRWACNKIAVMNHPKLKML